MDEPHAPDQHEQVHAGHGELDQPAEQEPRQALQHRSAGSARDVQPFPVAQRRRGEGEPDHQQHRERLRPGRAVVQHVAREHAPRDDQRDHDQADAGDDQAQAVQRRPWRRCSWPASARLPARTTPAARRSRERPASGLRAAGYWTAWMRLISSAYFAPYLSRTGCMASWKRLLVVDLDHLDAVRLHVGERLLLLGVQSSRCSLLRLLGEPHDQVLVLLRRASPRCASRTPGSPG